MILHFLDNPPDLLADELQLNRGGEPIDTGLLGTARRLLMQTRDSNHKELIQVGADNRKELYSFERGILRVFCLLQYPFLKLHQAEFAVDV